MGIGYRGQAYYTADANQKEREEHYLQEHFSGVPRWKQLPDLWLKNQCSDGLTYLGCASRIQFLLFRDR